MKKTLLAAAALFLLSTPLYAQTTAKDKLAWDQTAPDVATAQAYTYSAYADTATVGTTLSPVTCTGTVSPFLCSVPFPAFTPGPHTLQVTASNVAGESLKSNVFSFTFVVVPTAPANLRKI